MKESDILSRRYRTHPDAFLDSGPDGAFMLTPEGQIFRLNPVAEFIWSQLNGQRTAGEILAAIHQEFRVPSPQQAQADLEGFMMALAQANLIESVESA